MSKKVLILGSGFVAGPVVEYLSTSYSLTIASNLLQEAQQLASSFSNVRAVKLDVTDTQSIDRLVRSHDLVVSLVPYVFHVAIAKRCIEHQKSLVTASYVSPQMQALDKDAKKANVVLLNEIGLDPGIDHMSAMKIIDTVRSNKGRITAFSSWCGGLPAPESNDNPLGYKFAWAPKGVLLALKNSASYLRSGRQIDVDAKDLLTSCRPVVLSDQLKLEGYPNRNSLPYRKAYQIPECENLLRGTLRYPGFSEIMHTAACVGLLDDKNAITNPISYGRWLEQQIKTRGVKLDSKRRQAFEWLGLTDTSTDMPQGKTPLDAFCHLLEQRLVYRDGEVDMIALQHRFTINYPQGHQNLSSTLVVKGDKAGFSAMAKTVGYPVAIAAKLILQDEFTQKGVLIPVMKELYNPVLDDLAKLNIVCHESTEMCFEEAFFND